MPRSRLIERLERGCARPFTLVSAPPGFGKTTLVGMWLDSRGGAGPQLGAAWLSLDEGDSDLAVFVGHVLAAVQTVLPGFGGETQALLDEASALPLSALTGTLANELESIGGRLVLVLDDYHTIRGTRVHDIVADLLRYPLQALHLVTVTRRDPPLPLVRLRARGQMTEIRAQDLSFTPSEAGILVRDVMGVEADEATVKLLTAKTEGWVTGLRLAVLSLRHRGTPGRVPDGLQENSRYVMEYLLGEAVANQPADVQEVLLSTSILDRFCAPLCDALLDSAQETGTDGRCIRGDGIEPYTLSPSRFLLDEIERSNLFLVPLDDQRGWYRYHQLFKNLLEHLLAQRRSPEDIAVLHRRASAWLAEHGFPEEALRHALTAGNTSRAVDIVSQHQTDLMDREQWARLESWLQLFPSAILDREPDLLIVESWLAYHHGDMALIGDMLDRVETELGQGTPDSARACRIWPQIYALRAIQHFWEADGCQSVECARLAVAEAPRRWAKIRGLAYQGLDRALQLTGDPAAARSTLRDAMRTARADRQECFHVHLLGMQALAQWMDGDLDGLVEVASHGLEMAQVSSLEESAGWFRHLLGCTYYHRNDIAAAEAELTEVMKRREWVNGLCYALSGLGLALIHQARGEPERALEAGSNIVSFLLETQNVSLRPYVQAAQAELALRQGHVGRASQLVAQVGWGHAIPVASIAPLPQITKLKVLLAQGTLASQKQAEKRLSSMCSAAELAGDTRSLIELLALQAALHSRLGEWDPARAVLQRAIGLAEPAGFVRLFADSGLTDGSLLERAARRGIARDFVGRLAETFPPNREAMTFHLDRMPSTEDSLVDPLTEREMQVLALLAQRLTNKEIAAQLVISLGTVKSHAVRIYQKLNVGGRRQAVQRARELRILAPRETRASSRHAYGEGMRL